MKDTPVKDGCRMVPFPRVRYRITDALGSQHRKHVIHQFAEMDVAVPRQLIRRHREIAGESISFTAFVIGCVARAVEENRGMHAYRKGRNKLVVFDDVDIATLIEHELDGEYIATPHVVRRASSRTVGEIHRELRMAQQQRPGEFRELRLAERIFYSMPAFVRVLIVRAIERSPHWRKRTKGTVAVISVGMFGNSIGWMVPMTNYTLCITIGGISEKPGVVEGRVEVREYLAVTVTADHEIIDGAPLARFTSRLKELIENGYGLTAADNEAASV